MIDSVSPGFWPIVPLVPHWGIPHFIWRFMGPHGLARSSSLTGCSLGCRHDRCLIMILHRSVPKAIQLGPPFSALGCHHASPSERYILDHGYDSVMDLDDQDYMFDDRWFHVTCSSDLSHFRCHTRAYSLSGEIYRSSRSCMLIPTCEMYVEMIDWFAILWWSPNGASVEPFSQAHISRHLVAAMLLILGDVP